MPSERYTVPASFAQRRLWFVEQLNQSVAGSYVLPVALHWKGCFNGAAVEQGLNEIVRRHEVLRTRFESEAGEPVQVIEPEMRVRLGWVDVSGLEEREQEREVERLAREEGRRKFDLERGPLFRASVIRKSEQEHVLLLSLHHIISDGWSMGVLFRELERLYGAYGSGEAGKR